MKHYTKIDFTDGGKKKPVFSEEDLEKVIGHEWASQVVNVN